MNAWPPSLLLNWNLRSFCLVKCVTYWYLVSHVTSENLIEFTICSARPHASFYETDVFETYFLNRVPFKFLFQMPHQTSFVRIVFICLLTSWKITWLLHTFQMCVCAWWLKNRCHLRFFSKHGHQTTQYLNLMDSFRGDKKFFWGFTI